MKQQAPWFLSIAALVAAAGCVTPDDTESTATSSQAISGIDFEVDNDTDLAGGYYAGEAPLRFSSHTEWGRSVKASIVVGETPIDIVYEGGEYDDGVLSLEVRGELGERERQTLRGFTRELDRVFPYERDVDQPNGALLRIYAGYLTDWTLGPTPRPVITLITARMTRDPYRPDEPSTGGGPQQVPPPPAAPCGDVVDDDFVTVLQECCNGGTYVTWDHDAMPAECFHSQSNLCGVGSGLPWSKDPLKTGCPGRCGSDCWGVPTYTQDCLEHDLCLVHHTGHSPTSSVGVCGDELMDAVDDVAFIYGAALAWGPLFHTMPQHSLCFI